MKKSLLTTGIFVLFIFNLQAQNDDDFIKNKTTFGIKGGLSQSYKGKQSFLLYQSLDLYGGLFAETRLSRRWSFQSELLYSSAAGYRFIEIPLTLKYHITDKWSVFAGPSLDFSLNRSSAYVHIEPLVISAVLGTQYNFSKKFFMEARVNLGLKDQIRYNIPELPSRNLRRVFRIGIGYRF